MLLSVAISPIFVEKCTIQHEEDSQCACKCNIGTRLRNHGCSGKAISIVYSESVFVTLVIQDAKHMTVLHCLLWLVRLYHIFPHYLINGTTFRKTLLNIKHVFSPSLRHLSEELLVLRRNQRDITINVHRSSRKYALFLSDIS